MRKVSPKLLADKLVGVQPLSQPASLIHYLRYRYANDGKFAFAMFDKGYARILEFTDEFLIIDADLQTPNCECVRIKITDELVKLKDPRGVVVIEVTFENGSIKRGYHKQHEFEQTFKIQWI